jgi:biopolymer transport protein ExbD
MIDVVFLLLVFFLLAARFGAEGALAAAAPGAGAAWQGPPRLVEVAPGALFLNGVPTAPDELVEHLARLAPEPGDAVVLRGRAGASVQELVAVMELLAAAGFGPLILAE